MFRRLLHFACCSLVAAVFSGVFGCGQVQERLHLVDADGYTPQARELLDPLTQPAADAISSAKAAELARNISPEQQGLRSWRDMDFAVSQSLAWAKARPAGRIAVDRLGLRVSWGEICAGLTRLQSLLPQLDAAPELLAESFRWIRLGPDFSFTGYYEPTLQADRRPTAALPHPLYRPPPDLRAGVPYHTREAIDRQGVLRGRGLELAWVDETDAYFLQVQGSGRLRFPDGNVSHVLYAGKNNRQYVSLGRIMKEDGILPEGGVSMRAIRGYLAANPHMRTVLFDRNPSYVFFREAAQGPLGSMGRVLTPWVSSAVDVAVIPHGALLFTVLLLPDPDGRQTLPFYGLSLPQDTGGAIKGHRIDLFCGSCDRAAHTAGHLDGKGAVYLLLPK